MKSYLFILLLAAVTRSTEIIEYLNDCTLCVSSGYNYCVDDTKCMDNMSVYCTVIVDFPLACGAWSECADISINDADLFN